MMTTNDVVYIIVERTSKEIIRVYGNRNDAENYISKNENLILRVCMVR
jgi:hypothetical protein